MLARWIGICVVTCLMARSSSVAAQTPTASELARLVPAFSSQEADKPPFAFRVTCPVQEDLLAEFDLRWRKAGCYSMLLSDNETHTPIACFHHDGFAIYNAVERTVTFGPEVTPEFSLIANSESKVELHFLWNRPDGTDPDPASFKLDLTSLATTDSLQVETTPAGKRLAMTCPSPSGKSVVTWEFEIAPKIQFKQLGISSRADEPAFLRLHDIRTGNSISTLQAPKTVPAGSTIQAVPWKPDGDPSFVEIITELFHAAVGHAAITNAKYRQLSSNSHVRDWSQVVKQFELDRPLVVDLFAVDN